MPSPATLASFGLRLWITGKLLSIMRRALRSLRHLIACRHHQTRFAAPVYAAEPAGVEIPTVLLLFSILPDLHWLATAWARIAVAGDDDVFLSRPLARQCYHLTSQKKTSARKLRAPGAKAINRKSEFGWHISIGWHIAVDFETDADFH
jgi:hypothetical protein